ncbi:aldo/keto reductase [Amycolatopsis sp. NPDC049253]|uniref:aldo/keto reductase n=1 Tax=Amycolatopsis sp. NPDC049253 TaxID=3155274 RepID=UPI003440A2BC
MSRFTPRPPAGARATVPLGGSGLRVHPIGLGCMGMSQFYGAADRTESIATIHAAIDLGADFFDTSDVYGAATPVPGQPNRGFGHNERLLGEAVRGRRDEVVIGTKFSAKPGERGMTFDGRPEYVASACDASLTRLGTDRIDVYYYHRLDPGVPVEETVGAMADLVTAGKIRAIGLSHVPAEILRRAAAVAPVSALQSEYSLWERALEAEVLPVCRRLGITLVPYSPLGRAALTGKVVSGTEFDAADFRSTVPKFQRENLVRNLEPVAALREFADRRGATSGQVALAWLLAQSMDVAPIPGTKRVAYVRENLGATAVPLSADDVAELSRLFDPAAIHGGQYAS